MSEVAVENELQYKNCRYCVGRMGRKEIEIAEKEMPGLNGNSR